MWRENESGLERNLFRRSTCSSFPLSSQHHDVLSESDCQRVWTIFISEGNSNNTLCSKKIINCTMDGQVLMCHTLVCLLFACLFILLKPGISAQLQIKINTIIIINTLELDSQDGCKRCFLTHQIQTFQKLLKVLLRSIFVGVQPSQKQHFPAVGNCLLSRLWRTKQGTHLFPRRRPAEIFSISIKCDLITQI